MSLLKKYLVAGVLGSFSALAASAGAPGEAGAQIVIPPTNATTTVTAIGGVGWPNADKDCFQTSWSRVLNSCTSTKTFLLPVPVTVTQKNLTTATASSVGFKGRVYSGSTTATRVSCKAMVITRSNGARFSSTFHSGDGSNTSTKAYRSLGNPSGDLGFLTGVGTTLYVGNEDTAHLDCQVPAGAGVVSALATVHG